MCYGVRCHTAEWGKMPHSHLTLRQGIFNSIQLNSSQNFFPLNESLSTSIKIGLLLNTDEKLILPFWASFYNIMGNMASYFFRGVRCHSEDQIFALIFFGKYEYETTKLSRMCSLTPVPATDYTNT